MLPDLLFIYPEQMPRFIKNVFSSIRLALLVCHLYNEAYLLIISFILVMYHLTPLGGQLGPIACNISIIPNNLSLIK